MHDCLRREASNLVIIVQAFQADHTAIMYHLVEKTLLPCFLYYY